MLDFVLYEIGALAVVVAVLTATGAPLLKFIVRPLTLVQAARICAWAVFCCFGVLIVAVGLLATGAQNSNQPLSRQTIGDLALAAFVATAWFISRSVGRLGHPQRFPGAGAKVAFGWFVLSWVFAGIVYLIVGMNGA